MPSVWSPAESLSEGDSLNSGASLPTALAFAAGVGEEELEEEAVKCARRLLVTGRMKAGLVARDEVSSERESMMMRWILASFVFEFGSALE